MPTKIEWATETWNPITGCTPFSEGCKNCYAKRMAGRLAGRFGYPKDAPFAVTFHPDRLEEPLRWRKPRLVFVCSMGDFFHKSVTREMRDAVYNVVCSQPRHTFLFLTKRPEDVASWWVGDIPNVWLGVTAENQEQADRRIPILLSIPAAVRFVSVEPMLGPVDVSKHLRCESCIDPCACWCKDPRLNWVICGAETGPGARPLEVEWVLDLQRQCANANVSFFFKKWGARDKHGQPYGADGYIDGVLCRDWPCAI